MGLNAPLFELIPPTPAEWAIMLLPLKPKKWLAAKRQKQFSARLPVTFGLIWSGEVFDPSADIVIGPDQTSRITDTVTKSLADYGFELTGMQHLRERDKSFGDNEAKLVFFEIVVK